MHDRLIALLQAVWGGSVMRVFCSVAASILLSMDGVAHAYSIALPPPEPFSTPAHYLMFPILMPQAAKPVTQDGPKFPAGVEIGEAKIELEFCVSETGAVNNVRMVRGSGNPAIDAAAMTWLGKRAYVPAKLNGQPFASCAKLIIQSPDTP